MSRKEAFRKAKQYAGIPKSAQYEPHKYVYDGHYPEDFNGYKK